MAKKDKISFTFVDCVFSFLTFSVFYYYIFEWNL